jgi:hypothetical protein
MELGWLLLGLKKTGTGASTRIDPDSDPAAAFGTRPFIVRTSPVDINPVVHIAAVEFHAQKFSTLDRGHEHIIGIGLMVVKSLFWPLYCIILTVGPARTMKLHPEAGNWLP